MADVEKEQTRIVEPLDRKKDTASDGHHMWLSVFRKQIKEKMKRYMERQRDASSPTKGNIWGDTSSKREPGDVVHNTENKGGNNNKSEYITRLTSLRDSLINHEEASLAQALDRLRVHSLANKSQSNKLRMRPVDDSLSAPPLIHQRKNMVTTVERFRQIRPSRHQPVIFPLQGRQMLEMATPRPASEVPISNSGNSTNRSTRSQSEYMCPKPSHNKLDETVQANLQRLIQRTSSIPNIGRKALGGNGHPDGLEPKTKPLLNIRASLQKTHGHHLASPFLLNTHEDLYDPESQQYVRNSGDTGVENLSPQALKLGPALQEDTIDMEKLSQYYHKLISDLEADAEGGESGSKGGNKENGNNNNGNNKFFHYKIKFRHSPLKSSLAKGRAASLTHSEQGKRHYNSYNSVVSGSGKTIPFSELPNIAPRTNYAYPSDVISDIDVISENPNNNNNRQHPHHPYFPEVQTSYRLPVSEMDAASEISKWYGGKSFFGDKLSRPEGEYADGANYNHNNNNNGSGINKTASSLSKDGRVKIVVDMPNIIFNAASPENEDAPGGDGLENNSQNQGQGTTNSNSNQGVSPGMSLKKTVKQHELRQKELQNLLEDVKELNSWTEIARKRSIPEGT